MLALELASNKQLGEDSVKGVWKMLSLEVSLWICRYPNMIKNLNVFSWINASDGPHGHGAGCEQLLLYGLPAQPERQPVLLRWLGNRFCFEWYLIKDSRSKESHRRYLIIEWVVRKFRNTCRKLEASVYLTAHCSLMVWTRSSSRTRLLHGGWLMEV